MAALSAAMYLSGINVDQFGDGLQDFYSIASKCLDSPKCLKEDWKRSSSSLSSISVDSGYSRSIPEEPMTLSKFELLEQKTFADVIEALRNFEIWESAHAYLGVIDEIERRYYAREDELKAIKAGSTSKTGTKPKILYQGRDILNLLDNVRSGWRPSFAGLKDDQKELIPETKHIIDRLKGDKIPRHIRSKCSKPNCNFIEPVYY